MATKADFSEDEWKAMEKGVTGAGMLVSVSDRDFTDSFGEASALAKALAAHRESPSELVRELAGPRGTGFGMTASPQEVESETIASLGVALATLTAKAPDEEIDAYRTLVLEVADAVAEAKGGVTPVEEETIGKLRLALGQG
jgi:hypothetical protein